MAWSFTSLRYGWQIAASIVLAGTTIYVANNLRQRVNQADVIEIALGVTERCLATQTSTNPTYSVNPPSFVRSWYSNDYTTNGAILYTNVFANAIGFRTDRAMLASLDTTIKALVPYYVDTNSVYDGTTNIVMLTVTGLWASLHIGDGTNKFTSEPAWVGTNGVTNAATYGDYPSWIYVTDLQERYKVLNALKFTTRSASVTFPDNNGKYLFIWTGDNLYHTWADLIYAGDAWWATNGQNWTYAKVIMESSGQVYLPWSSYGCDVGATQAKFNSPELGTNLEKSVNLYVSGSGPTYLPGAGCTNPVFNAFGYPIYTNGWGLWSTKDCGYSSTGFVDLIVGPTGFEQPGWCIKPTRNGIRSEAEGWEISDYKEVINWQFNYCTNSNF